MAWDHRVPQPKRTIPFSDILDRKQPAPQAHQHPALPWLASKECAFADKVGSCCPRGEDRQPPTEPWAGTAGELSQQLHLPPAAHLAMMTASCTATVLPVCSNALVSRSSVVALLLCSSSSTRSASVARAASPAAISACRNTRGLCWATSGTEDSLQCWPCCRQLQLPAPADAVLFW